MVPSGGLCSNQDRDTNPVTIKDSNELFKTLGEWNAVLEGLQKPHRIDAADHLPQSKKRRPSPPVRRRHKKMMGGVS
jgi:hypothetical protein